LQEHSAASQPERTGLVRRYSALALGLLLALGFWLCVRNNRTFLVEVRDDGVLQISRGAFFIAGMVPQQRIRIGLEQDWLGNLPDRELAAALEQGIRLEGSNELHALLLRILLDLAHRERGLGTEKGLERAAYYLEVALRQSPDPQIKRELAGVQLQAARLFLEQDRLIPAREALAQARRLAPSREADQLLALLRKREASSRPAPDAEAAAPQP
jgi:hypothetical protein